MKNRLQAVLEPKLQATQFGCRPKRSTPNALQILRRLQIKQKGEEAKDIPYF